MTTDNLANTSAEIEKIDLRLQALEEEKSRLLSRKTELESATTELAVRPTTLSAKEKVESPRGLPEAPILEIDSIGSTFAIRLTPHFQSAFPHQRSGERYR